MSLSTEILHEAVDHRVETIRQQLSLMVSKLRDDPTQSRESIESIEADMTKWISTHSLELGEKAKQLSDHADPERLAKLTLLTDEDWALLAIYWVSYINLWVDDWLNFAVMKAVEGTVEALATQWATSDKFIEQLTALIPEFMQDGRPLYEADYLHFKTVFGPVLLITEGSNAYPWKREWLVGDRAEQIRWVENEPDYVTFLQAEEDPEAVERKLKI